MQPTTPPLLVSRDSHPEWKDPTTTRCVRVGNVTIGGERPVMIAGPCAVESREQTLEIARAVADAGADAMRGGAFKPRTNPHQFQGLGEEGLRILAAAREETGLPIVTEVMDTRLVDLVAEYADVLQIGSRNMQNYPLLTAVGQSGKPVLLKRGFGATVDEWICAAEYLAVAGNMNILMCERGIRTFANQDYDRATLDLAAVDLVKRRTPFPVIVDPSHAAGRADLVTRLGLAGLCQGADGLLVEVIAEGTDPSKVLCDGKQCVYPAEIRKLVNAAERVSRLLD